MQSDRGARSHLKCTADLCYQRKNICDLAYQEMVQRRERGGKANNLNYKSKTRGSGLPSFVIGCPERDVSSCVVDNTSDNGRDQSRSLAFTQGYEQLRGIEDDPVQSRQAELVVSYKQDRGPAKQN